MMLKDKECGYPRICAHRGFNMAAPENTIPAFAMAVALGAQEIELDLWEDKDGELIVCHDPKLLRTTGVDAAVSDLTTEEIANLDAGSWFNPLFAGVRMPRFSDVLELAAQKTILNIHIKSLLRNKPNSPEMKERSRDLNIRHTSHAVLMPPLQEGVEKVLPEVENRPVVPYSEKTFARILSELDRFNCREWAYITGEKDVLETARKMAPDIPRCCLEGHMNYSIVEHALEYGCTRVQFCKGLTTQKMIDRAKENGLICNLFWADTAEEAKAYLDIGIDCVLTNNYQIVSRVLKDM